MRKVNFWKQENVMTPDRQNDTISNNNVE